MDLDEAIAYYRTHKLKGEQAIKIEGIPGAVGLTDEGGDVQPLLGPPAKWKIESSTGAHSTVDGFSLSPEKR